ncbi:MAG: 5'/3'-nucleotidase SurE [Bacteroidota bacterium]
MKKPLILITNDDGVHAPGIRYLIEAIRPLGDVLVVAPDKPQSAMGHAVTISVPLRLHLLAEEPGYREYSCNGTPADCVKLGEKVIIRGKPDLIVSGINHGSNASINVLYSGTMAAVIEGAMENIPAIGFSLNEYSHSADFSHCGKLIRSVASNVLAKGLPDGICLNVNIPALNGNTIKGIKITRQGKAFWDENFDERKDPHKRDYYWLRGEFVNLDQDEDNDHWAINNNYVSIVPVQIDLTAHHMIDEIKQWDIEL